MRDLLRIALLGRPQIYWGDIEVDGFVSQKAQVLLCYLAATGRPHTREHLADLLWGQMPEERARANLRTALHNLQQIAGDSIKATRSDVAFDKSAAHWLDLDEFARQTQERSSPEELLAASALYRGEFLDDVSIADAPAFEEWLYAQRESCCQVVTRCLETLVAHLTACRNYAEAAEQAQRLLNIAPWHEGMHRELMLLLARQGRFSAALAQYEQCRRSLLRELDVPPLPETTAVYERIRAARSGRHQNLPAQATPFVGRQAELGRLATQLHDPSCRLLILVGLGGVGKTRLALELAAQERLSFLNGICYVPLEGPTAPHTLATEIAKALELPSVHDPIRELLAYLRSKELLLVVDDAEYLLPGAELLVEILREARDVKIVGASRRRLNLRQEWIHDVQGLAYPPEGPTATRLGAEHYDAVQLFLATARRYHPAPVEGPLEPVERICRMVEGMPLGIELAAAWARTMSPQDILVEIERGLDLLSTPLQHADARHQSLGVVLEQSWRSLAADEQGVLGRLSVFKGGFPRDAALTVAQASAQTLAALVDRSLLRMHSAGRFEIHQLVRQFSAAKLAAQAGSVAAAHARHARYYAHFLMQAAREQRSDGQQSGLVERVAKEIDNIRAAWSWMVEQPALDLLGSADQVLYLFYEYRGWFQEGLDRFEAAVSAVQNNDAPPTPHDLLLARLLARAGWFHWRLNFYHTARERLQESLSLVPESVDPAEAGFAVGALGLVADSLGEYATAHAYYGRRLDICRQTGDRVGEGRVLNELGVVARVLGSHAEAAQRHRAALTISQELGDRWGIATVLNNQGLVAQRLGEYQQAESAYQQALAIRRELGDAWGGGVSLITLADLYCDMGELALAAACLEESNTICQETGGPWGRAYWLMIQGNLAHCQEDFGRAGECHSQSLLLWRRIGVPSKIARTLNYWGSDLLALGSRHEAEQTFQESAITSRRIGYQSGLATALWGLGHAAYAGAARRTAGLYLSRALRIAQEIGERPVALAVQSTQAQLLAQSGHNKQSAAALTQIIDHAAARFVTRKAAAHFLHTWTAVTPDGSDA